ncbi:hypothetical protein [Streptomyces rimosus]|uniref:hypothetical protein n=1 Tax=Streptomyces rimosus TaxID=1927 RepID=UPI0004C76CC3|nr:hypothetical protein [Streptomyces rimosus]
MFRGSARELRRREKQAAEYAAQVTELLNKIDDLKCGAILFHPGTLAGPGFAIRRIGDRWTLNA